MLERELCELVTAMADRLAVRHYHSPDSRREIAGWPDFVFWAPGGVLWREVKSDNGRPTRAQLTVGAELQAAGADWAIWRPDDWRRGLIVRQLVVLAGTRQRPGRGETGALGALSG